MNINDRWGFLVICLSIIIFNNCETEIDSSVFMKPEPVVFSIINPYDSINYVKLNKTFSGGHNALISAKISDSLFFDNSKVKLEVSTSSGLIIYSRRLELVENVPKESGLFASDRNDLYVLRDNFSNYSFFGNKVHLIIEIPGRKKITSSSSIICEPTEFISPTTKMSPLKLVDKNPFSIVWKSGCGFGINTLIIRINYTEITKDKYTNTYVEIIRNKINSFSSFDMKQDYFFRWLARSIEYNPEVLQRIFNSIDFSIRVAGKELTDYVELGKIASDKTGKPYTNIINGLGIFSCIFEDKVEGLDINNETRDSLQNGRITKHLNFVFN